MLVLDIAIIIFILMETGNVLILYFAPNSRKGNGVAVFNPWFRAKKNEGDELFARYMANWVANSKLIFIMLLLVILIVGNEMTKFLAVLSAIISISMYFVKLAHIVKKLDNMGEITPKGYYKKLNMMVAGFVLIFSTAALTYVILG